VTDDPSSPSDQELLHSVIGTTTDPTTVVIERGPVAFFAEAVLAEDLVYRDPRAATAAGFDAVPVPPTYPFVMANWGRFPEIQPDAEGESTTFLAVLGPLLSRAGLLLHGEQELTYHRPVVVGDVLHGVSEVVDAYQKHRNGRTMTFVVNETRWTDDAGTPVVTTRFTMIHRS